MAALVREAVKDETLPDVVLQLVIALTNFPVWTSMQKVAADDLERRRLVARLLGCAIRSARWSFTPVASRLLRAGQPAGRAAGLGKSAQLRSSRRCETPPCGRGSCRLIGSGPFV